MRKELDRIKHSSTKLTVVCAERGPETIESTYDEALAIQPTLEFVEKANQEGYDVVVIACFSDPGLDAAREISRIPVLGIEETVLHIASMLGARFTILTPLSRLIPSKKKHVHTRALDHYLASVRAWGMTVAETEAHPHRAKKNILKVAREAMDEDGTEVIVLGCAGLAGYSENLESELGIAVLDPLSVTFKIAEAFAELGLRPSKVGLYAYTLEK
jgi:allantoin racemase